MSNKKVDDSKKSRYITYFLILLFLGLPVLGIVTSDLGQSSEELSEELVTQYTHTVSNSGQNTLHEAGFQEGSVQTYSTLAAGYAHTCAILDDGSVSCWGYNSNGQLGDGTTTNRNTPTQTSSLGTDRTAIAITAGSDHTCAILDDGSVSCWGYNGYGRLGDGTTTNRNTPTQTSSLGTDRTAWRNIKSIQVSERDYDNDGILNIFDQSYLTCSIGTYSSFLKLGVCTDASAGYYVPDSRNHNSNKISTGTSHTCTILDDGSVSCWGDNSVGPIGDGTTTQRTTPTPTSSLGTGRTAAEISGSSDHTCVLVDHGSVSCWGDNSDGQLGDGTTTDRLTPTPTSSLGFGRTAVAIATGQYHTCAILDDGSVSCWGRNDNGRLGDGTTTDRLTPTQTSSLGTGRTAALDSNYLPGGTSQTACAAGTYQASTGQSACTDASAGYYVDSTAGVAQTTQTACLAGTYNANTASTTSSDCLDASAGYYVDSTAGTAQTSQTACIAGTYNANTGSTTSSDCLDADAGYYVDSTASTAQTACAAGTYQSATGQTSCTDASAGYYVLDSRDHNSNKIASGEIFPTAVFSEPDIGSDLAHLKTRGKLVDNKYLISGNKTWITHGARADLMTLLVRTNNELTDHKGLSMFLAEKPRETEDEFFPAEGMSGGEINVIGYRGMKEFDIGFDNFEVPSENLLGEEEGKGFVHLMSTFESARIQTAARAIGVSQNACDVALTYANDRIQFSEKLINFPRISEKLIMMFAETMIVRQLTFHAANIKDSKQRCDMEAGMAKLLGARVAWSSADNALQIHGGIGFASETQISRILADARILSIFEGTAEIQAQVIARRLMESKNR